MRCLGALLAAVLLAGLVGAGQPPELKLPDRVSVQPGRLLKLEAKASGPVTWVNAHDDLDLIASETGRWAIVSGSKPGSYRVAALTWNESGISSPSFCIVKVEAASPGPARAAGAGPAPAAATGRLRFGTSGCSATVIGPRRPDGRWDILAASHCVSGVGARGTFQLPAGKALGVSVVAWSKGPDLSWMVTDDVVESLPYALLASTVPASGTPIWHQGFGVDKPGNKETGTVLDGGTTDGMLRMRLSVSSGDSGTGIFRTDTGELVAVVCCYFGQNTYGGTSILAARLRPGNTPAMQVEQPFLPMPKGKPPRADSSDPAE